MSTLNRSINEIYSDIVNEGLQVAFLKKSSGERVLRSCLIDIYGNCEVIYTKDAHKLVKMIEKNPVNRKVVTLADAEINGKCQRILLEKHML